MLESQGLIFASSFSYFLFQQPQVPCEGGAPQMRLLLRPHTFVKRLVSMTKTIRVGKVDAHHFGANSVVCPSMHILPYGS